MSRDIYVCKNANYDGYNQAFNEIGDWTTVEEWAKDGSLEKGDIVYKLEEVEQPKIVSA